MSLFYSLNLSSQALLTFKRGLDITNKNMTNVYTDGYSRVNPVFENLHSGGVYLRKAERVFDNSLFNRVINVNQFVVGDEAYKDILEQIEFNFNDIQGSGFSNALDSFFASMNDVITNPDDLSARESFLHETKNLIGRIRSSYDNLKDMKEKANLTLRDDIKKINELTAKLAKINSGIRGFFNDEARVNSYKDERDRTLKELSSLIDIKATFQNDGTVNVSTSKGFDLVLFDKSHNLTFETDSDSNPVIKWEGINITNELGKGKVGGIIKGVNYINDQIDRLNRFTEEFASNINDVHDNGYDLNGNQGGDLFNYTSGNAASDIDLAFEDPKLVAAAANSTDLAADNENMKALLSLKDEKIAGLENLTFNEYYNNKIVAPLAFELSHTKDSLQDNRFLFEAVEQKLQEKSSVNLDEELINLTQLQRSYEAAARIINVTDELLQTVLGLVD